MWINQVYNGHELSNWFHCSSLFFIYNFATTAKINATFANPSLFEATKSFPTHYESYFPNSADTACKICLPARNHSRFSKYVYKICLFTGLFAGLQNMFASGLQKPQQVFTNVSTCFCSQWTTGRCCLISLCVNAFPGMCILKKHYSGQLQAENTNKKYADWFVVFFIYQFKLNSNIVY